MASNFPKYKQLKISLKSDSEVLLRFYSEYKDDEKFEFISETDDLIIEGVPSNPNGKNYSEELFEYNKDAIGVFEKFRIYETKDYIVNYDTEKCDVILNNENELAPKRTGKGQVSFKVVNYLGKSSLKIKSGEKEFLFPFEIVPLKIDYEEDYVKLTDDIAKKCSALLLDYASPTNLSFHDDASKRQESPLEMFIFIRQFCSSENIEYLFQCIKNNPDRHLVTEEVLSPFGTAPISKKFFSNPFKYGKNFSDDGNDYIPELISSTRKYDSYDTPANRFIRFALNTFGEVCQNVIERLNDGYSYKEEALFIKNKIENILNDSFFDDVQLLTSMPFNNQVLQKREGYAQVFNAFNMLDIAKQLDWKGERQVYQGQARNIALLYEYWLVFKFMEILENIGAEIEFSDEKQKNQMFTKENGLLISLKEGHTSYYSALIKDKNLRIQFYYNRTFRWKDFEGTDYQGSYSRDFRPDYTLAIFPAEYDEDKAVKLGEVSYVHFDAKYRVTDITSLFGKDFKQILKEQRTEDKSENKSTEEIEEELENEYFSEEKQNETINTYNRGDLLKMHTYNDAIRKTIGSYVLYPGTSNNENKFSVYDELLPGVGAFAIRPGEEKIMGENEGLGEKTLREFVEKIIDFKATQSSRQNRKDYFENLIIKNPSDHSLKIKTEKTEETRDSELTMIGFVRQSYYDYLNQKYFREKKQSEFYFYFHAIKNGNVLTLHKETNIAKYLRLTLTDFYKAEIKDGKPFLRIEPFNSEILSIELVSKQKLQEVLSDFDGKENFHADYYYLVRAKVMHYLEGGVVAISTDENDVISPYSPKIVDLRLTQEQ